MLKCKNRVKGWNYSEHLAGFTSFLEANAVVSNDALFKKYQDTRKE
jgi:hypothetical protein